jgi:hypothetical protein
MACRAWKICLQRAAASQEGSSSGAHRRVVLGHLWGQRLVCLMVVGLWVVALQQAAASQGCSSSSSHRQLVLVVLMAAWVVALLLLQQLLRQSSG